jgi:hypothetical protein
MLGISPKHALATVAVAAGVLAAAGPASAGYQHNQTEHDHVQDGTSNTILFGRCAAAQKGFAIDVGTSENVACDGIGAAYGPIR